MNGHVDGEEDFEGSLELYVNGVRKVLLSPDPKMTLLQYVRSLGLTGTKLGCGEGGCGACTVIISKFVDGNKEQHLSVNACLMPLCSLDGACVTTIEGLGSSASTMHPVQERIANCHGSQCGFCTPGIVMSTCAQLKQDANSTPHDLEDCLDGNLCRCTGYRPILDAVKSLSRCKDEASVDLDMNGCSSKALQNSASETLVHNTTEQVVKCGDAIHGIEKLQPVIPEKLMTYRSRPLFFKHGNISWYQPTTLTSLLKLKDQFPSARLVVGNTEVGIETHFKGMEYPIIINPSKIEELNNIIMERDGIRVGGSVSINLFREFVKDITDKKGVEEYKIRSLTAIYHMLSWFASNQIRNAACLAGNIVTASPISDLNPMLLACDAKLVVQSVSGGVRHVEISNFFKSYRKVDLAPSEVLVAVWIPYTSQLEFTVPFKQARRREDDISIVTGGIRISLGIQDIRGYFIKDARIAFGGLAPTTILGKKTAEYLVNKPFEPATFETACSVAQEEFALPPDVPGGQAEYRTALAASFIFKAFYIVNVEMGSFIENCHHYSAVNSMPDPFPVDDSILKSASSNWVTLPKPPTRGEQSYHMRKGGIQTATPPHAENSAQERETVGAPLVHKSASLQVTGEAIYTDDQPLPPRAVHAALVTSTKAHARIRSVDLTDARNCDGFLAYFDRKNVQGCNDIGAVIKDEEVFATEVVKHVGAVIGIIIAETHLQALYAAKKVKVDYEELPAIISIQDAIRANAFFECFPPTDNKQDFHEICNAPDAEFNRADVIVEGSSNIGGQEHFYLETNATIVTPTENGSLEILSSTQNPTKTQKFCAAVLGLQASKVVARCKRMGGGFGGKETRSVFIACAAAVAAMSMNRPVSINIERDMDMQITGQRHAFHVQYRAGCSFDGKLQFLDAQIYSNAGFSLDLSQAVMDRALFHCDNVYHWPALRVRGKVCRTNQASHTAFRGFGGPQGLMVSEIVLEHLAHATGIDKITLRHKNFYTNGDKTHFGQTVSDFYVDKLWKEIHEKADLESRRAAVVRFNEENKWKKRGLATIPTKFGINFTAKFMNQGGALVHVYTDGTVLVSHGGTEMGQGLHTKMIQVAAQSFGIPDTDVHVAETATNTVANTSPTAASMSTDLYGMAVLDACEQILARLEPLRKKMSNGDQTNSVPWKKLIEVAFFERIDLSAHGYYAVDSDRCGYDWNHPTCGVDNSQRGMPFNYFTQGVCAVEVEVDCLTGDSVILRTDINMDIGKSINPALDIGQIEGAFTQGFGWSTMEELVWGDSDHPWIRPGNLFTKGPGTYKIPAFNDVPKDFRIYLSDTENKFCVHSSKAIGEPPFFLGSTVYWAINEAINAFRKSEVENPEVSKKFFLTHLPATSERIRMACCDNIVDLCTRADGEYRPKGSW